ncbi:heavy metal translocating P-type ATPase [Piscicoccus intestinalis]|uniref:heavy metal translocating P-type ATPase n=1 Tax=Piscicoccus intestinalis TaxID=746033 RepID=UPI000838C1C1|nr:heavy metal translocating P-type ATPase [Piscicoccus intestinalis]
MEGTLARFVTRFVTRYPLVAVVVCTGVVGGVLHLSGAPTASRWVVSAFALAMAACLAKGMIADLRAGTYGIDLLAVTAIVSTVVVGEHWASLVVCLMLTGGEALEDFARNRASRELSALLANVPEHTHRVGPDGALSRIAVVDVAVGDVLSVRPGELVPVDGALVSPAATVDESSLTGESMPVEKVAGEELLSGSVNGSAAVLVRASATASDSQYQRIVELVREAQASRAAFVRLADRVAIPFTLVSFVIAGVAWWVSGNPSRFAEVLVVATPCPLIIAAPVAFMAGMGRAAKLGIIVKDSASLEKLARLRTVAFDKTGTLTRGVPAVAGVHPAPGHTADEVLTLAAAAESLSTHPLAAAIVQHAQQRGLSAPEAVAATETVAAGVEARVGERVVRAGKAGFVGADATAIMPAAGNSGVHVSVDGGYAGLVELGDQLRPEAGATLRELRRLGVTDTVMLTGDAAATAQAVAVAVGVDEARAGLLPADKVAAVREAPARPVMMVGDGVNDAPVLAAADVGVAMGAKGSAAASQSADVVVMQDDVYRVARSVHVGRRTMAIAWQAIAIGLGLSVVLMLIAATGVMPAVVGAAMQEVVDLACILWALLAARPGKDEKGHTTPTSMPAPVPQPRLSLGV